MLTNVPDPTEAWIMVARGDERGIAELALVLIARDLEHRREATPYGWEIWVPVESAPAAVAELDAYRRENARPAAPRPSVDPIDTGWPGVGAYAAVLLAVFVFLRRDLLGFDWLAAGRLEAGQVAAGEWWRAVTALTVHLDVSHLGSNLAFGSFFGYFVGRHVGNGLGWAAIVAAGTLGNLLNALLQPATHRSIGASTAVFAALGILSAYSWRRGLIRHTWRARVGPIVAGIALLAYTGTGGANTDIVAHLTGFLAGFGAGALLASPAVPRGVRAQSVYAAVTAGAVTLAWWIALTQSG